MLMVSSEELEQLVLEVDFGPEINCVQLKSGCARGHDIHKLDMGFELCTSATGC
jgi:hypothetical protein